jgi:glycosyltransferase involved in cell wall biosynthesis
MSENGTSPWAGLIVMCSSSNWDDTRLADRHMAERLTAHAPVLFVDPPISHLTRFNKPAVAESTRGPRLRIVAPRLARYTPVVAPKPTHPAMIGVTSRLVRRQLRAAVRSLGGDVRAVVSTWLFVDAYGALGESRRIYWWRDDPVGAAVYWGASAERLGAAEARLAEASDLIVAVNEGAAERWEERGRPATYLPNGCDAEFFADVDDAVPAADVDLPGPIAGVVGQINSRTDLALLEAVADSGMSLLLIGPKEPDFEPERFERLAARPNVRYLGARPFEQLRSYLKVIDVGLVPYGFTEFNRWSFPLKTLEYLAAGRPVVATSLPAVRWLDTDLIALADSPEDFAAAAMREARLATEPALVARRRAFAAKHSWGERATRFARLLGVPA